MIYFLFIMFYYYNVRLFYKRKVISAQANNKPKKILVAKIIRNFNYCITNARNKKSYYQKYQV